MRRRGHARSVAPRTGRATSRQAAARAATRAVRMAFALCEERIKIMSGIDRLR
jgi:hypothetical protein